MNIKLCKTISRENILEYVSQEELMEFFTKIPVDTPLFCSPLRVDNNPSCSYFTTENGTLLLKDWARNKYYSVWDVGSIIKELSHYKLLNYIVDSFNLPLTRWGIIFESRNYRKPLSIAKHKSKIPIFMEFKFKEISLDYWAEYGITKTILEKYGVKETEYIKIGERFIVDINNSIYVYTDFPEGRVKVYRPLADKKQKWKSTTTKEDISGINQLPYLGGQCLFITSSLKDVMVFRSMGFWAICPQSEQILIDEAIMSMLKDVFKYIFISFDDDEAGHKGANLYVKVYPFIKKVCISTNKYKKRGLKDISDYRKHIGYHKTLKLLKKQIIKSVKASISQQSTD